MASEPHGVRGIENPERRTIARFMLKVSLSPGGCWLWLAAKDKDGYGAFQSRGLCGDLRPEKIRAHRFSYETFKGKIPAGMIVCHKCDNPTCVNPGHLFLSTAQGNVADRVAKGRTAKAASHGSKTCPEKWKESRAKKRKKYHIRGERLTLVEIAEKYKVPLKVLRSRLDRKIEIERAVLMPPGAAEQRHKLVPPQNKLNNISMKNISLQA